MKRSGNISCAPDGFDAAYYLLRNLRGLKSMPAEGYHAMLALSPNSSIHLLTFPSADPLRAISNGFDMFTAFPIISGLFGISPFSTDYSTA